MCREDQYKLYREGVIRGYNKKVNKLLQELSYKQVDYCPGVHLCDIHEYYIIQQEECYSIQQEVEDKMMIIRLLKWMVKAPIV